MSSRSRKNSFETRRAKCILLLIFSLAQSLLSCSSKGEQQAQSFQPSQQQVRQTPQPVETHVLRVCADPNNLPFSNQRLEGFENKIADLIARDMNASVQYTWWAQRRGFIRNTLKTGACDVVMGVPTSFEMALTTNPYYRSTYVFVYRRDRNLNIHSFDDPALHTLKVGVQMIGDDFSNSPPAHALTNRHIISNVVGYTVYGDYRQDSPPASIIDAVGNRQNKPPMAWGPLAGYFAKRQKVALEIVPVSPQIDQPVLPFVFDISIGVRHGDSAFKEELERVLQKRKPEIESILDEYGVPRVEAGQNQG